MARKQLKYGGVTRAAILFIASCLPIPHAGADSASQFDVRYVSSRLVDDVYHADVRIDMSLTQPVIEALESGVNITLEMPIEVYRPRAWVWDAGVASLSQRYRLAYHALTGQYVVTNLNSKVQSSYPTRRAALNAIGAIEALPVLDRRLLKVGEHYMARLRMRLAVEELPSPLRLWAYLSDDWRLASEWYTWQLQ